MKRKKILRTKKYLTKILSQKQVSKRYVDSMNKYLCYRVDYLIINDTRVNIFKYYDNSNKYRYNFLIYDFLSYHKALILNLCAIPVNRVDKGYNSFINKLFPGIAHITIAFKR